MTMENRKYPMLVETSTRASYWEMGPERFQAFKPNVTAQYVASKDNGAGYARLDAIKRLKGD